MWQVQDYRAIGPKAGLWLQGPPAATREVYLACFQHNKSCCLSADWAVVMRVAGSRTSETDIRNARNFFAWLQLMGPRNEEKCLDQIWKLKFLCLRQHFKLSAQKQLRLQEPQTNLERFRLFTFLAHFFYKLTPVCTGHSTDRWHISRALLFSFLGFLWPSRGGGVCWSLPASALHWGLFA